MRRVHGGDLSPEEMDASLALLFMAADGDVWESQLFMAAHPTAEGSERRDEWLKAALSTMFEPGGLESSEKLQLILGKNIQLLAHPSIYSFVNSAAEMCDPMAQLLLGRALRIGLGEALSRDLKKALEMLHAASNNGLNEAECEIDDMLSDVLQDGWKTKHANELQENFDVLKLARKIQVNGADVKFRAFFSEFC